MNCQEIRIQLEERARTGNAELGSDSGVTSHVASCASCRQFVQERRSLGQVLQLLRESAGPTSESLDAEVVAEYRRFIAERGTMPRRPVRKAYFPITLQWIAVSALLLIVTAIALYSTRKPAKTIAVRPVQPAPIAAPLAPETEAPPQVRPVRRAVSPVRKHSSPSESHPASARAVAPIPDDFRGLIYCDELSCNGAMDVVRVQLPSSAIARPTSAFRPISGPVNADVLIGPDGIARGIRIEQQEF